ncbi:ribosome biogenesis protein bop1, putative [Entamoeba invadens IP1]|uniref:Ribosome biogenesis protein bop1, putative n=1 Tax=Entamoeba invadens IP1 TaxID=370355 RepID=A0A0A1U088_ENTIV|nr:ribosome biogenesis protein bop1, putative [Entamoeba invadens IP1]ELP87305.1 ribosome biogenesis protein bop1, putative [Entamoeba invadens IP1]|eukprot:XP_004254076.1 ribosome biogenesis protein bop1, putative [Entamoeba invadens IP1]
MSTRKVYDEENDDMNTSDEVSVDTLGNIPLEWYDDYEHQGYGLDGKPLPKPTQGAIDSIDKFLALTDDPNYYKTVYDENGNATVLNPDDIRLVNAILSNKTQSDLEKEFPSVTFPYDDWMIPVSDPTPSKKSFIPNYKENKLISKLAKKLAKKFVSLPQKVERKTPRIRDVWAYAPPKSKRSPMMPLPPPPMPTDADSYHPPPEFKKDDQEDFQRLMDVPQYSDILKDRYTRCLELYVAPRKTVTIKDRKDHLKETILPPLEELRPFPSNKNTVLRTGKILRCVAVDPLGEGIFVRWLGTKDDILYIACDEDVYVLPLNVRDIERDLSPYQIEEDKTEVFTNKTSFNAPNVELKDMGVTMVIHHPYVVKDLSLHRKGHYIACIFGSSSMGYCVIHHIPSKKSQNPVKGLKGLLQKAIFHPSKPILAVASLRRVVLFDLQKGATLKKLNVKTLSISDIAFHPCGEHLIVTTFDRKCVWYDLQAGVDPYKVMRLHNAPCRSLAFHQSYPLFASIGDDALIQVMHASASSDITLDPVIIPLVKLKGHNMKGKIGGIDLQFHPILPWIYSVGADGTMQMFTDWF